MLAGGLVHHAVMRYAPTRVAAQPLSAFHISRKSCNAHWHSTHLSGSRGEVMPAVEVSGSERSSQPLGRSSPVVATRALATRALDGSLSSKRPA